MAARIKSIFGGSIGNLVEWYDWYVYAAFSLYFSSVFFPPANPTIQLLNAAAVFAIGFVVRPIGGWIMGIYADRHGRKKALTLSILFMCSGSMLIAVTPSFATVGWLSPAMLIFARIVQGLSLGGEYGTSATYLSEMATHKNRGFYTSFLYVTLSMGQLLALAVLVLLQQVFLTPEELQAWGWRIPFVIGGLLAIVAAYIRRGIDETPSFEIVKESGAKGGLRQLLKTHPREVLLVVGLTMGGAIAFNAFTTYSQKFLVNSAGWSKEDASLTMTAALFLFMSVQPLFGALSDRVGPKALADLVRNHGFDLYRADHDDPRPYAGQARRLSADHGGPALRQRLHLDRRRGEGGDVLRRSPGTGRRPALFADGIDLRRHCGISGALPQEHWARAMVFLLCRLHHRRVAGRLHHDARDSIEHGDNRDGLASSRNCLLAISG